MKVFERALVKCSRLQIAENTLGQAREVFEIEKNRSDEWPLN